MGETLYGNRGYVTGFLGLYFLIELHILYFVKSLDWKLAVLK